MELNLDSLVQLVVVAGFIGAGINYIIIRPLGQAIQALQATIIEFKKLVDKLQETQHDIDKRLSITEEQIKVANHRIDDLEEVIRK